MCVPRTRPVETGTDTVPVGTRDTRRHRTGRTRRDTVLPPRTETNRRTKLYVTRREVRDGPGTPRGGWELTTDRDDVSPGAGPGGTDTPLGHSGRVYHLPRTRKSSLIWAQNQTVFGLRNRSPSMSTPTLSRDLQTTHCSPVEHPPKGLEGPRVAEGHRLNWVESTTSGRSTVDPRHVGGLTDLPKRVSNFPETRNLGLNLELPNWKHKTC